MTTAVKVRAGLYLRISQDRLGEELGIARQREDCVALAARKGWTVLDEYADNDVSAYSTKPRPQYLRMLRDLADGVIDAVVVWDEDRLTRRPIEIEGFIELADDHGIQLASVAGDIDIATESGRLHLRIKAAVARDEVEKKARRQRRQRQQVAEAGRIAGGPRAFGYQQGGMELDPLESKVVKNLYGSFLSGATLSALARELNRAGLTTGRGNKWTRANVREVLANPRNAGIRGVRHLLPGKAGRSGARQQWHTEVGPAAWPEIVPREQWDAVMVILKDPKRGERHVGNRQKYLLSGIAECWHCGEPLITGRRDQTRLLRCPSLAHVCRRAEPIEEAVLTYLMAKLADPRAMAALVPADDVPDISVTELRAQQRALHVKKDEATELWTDGILDRDSLRHAHARVDVKLGEIDQQLAKVTRIDRAQEIVGVDDPKIVWDAWPLEVQRRLIKTRLRIRVMSGKSGRPGGRRFDPESVVIEWRE